MQILIGKQSKKERQKERKKVFFFFKKKDEIELNEMMETKKMKKINE